MDDDALWLTRVCLGLALGDRLRTKHDRPDAPTLFGHRLEPDRRGAHAADGLREPVPFTGGLLIGSDFIGELYVHMGFHPAWKYLRVYELLFEQGRLEQAADCSEQMAEFRAEFNTDRLRPTDRDQVDAWIEQCFRVDYRL